MATIAPRNFTVTLLSYSSVRFDWLDCADDELNIDLLLVNTSTGQVFTTSYAANTITATISGLSGSTTYTAQLRVVGPSSTVFSSILLFTTAAAPSAPSAPTGLTWTLPTETGGRLDWTLPGGTLLGSEIEVYDAINATTSYRTVSSPAGTYWVFSGLLMNRQYRFRVRSRNAVGWSDWSTAIFGSTLSDQDRVPDSPTGLTESSVTENTATLTWVDRSVNEAMFLLRWGPGSVLTESANVAPNVTTFSVTGLVPDTQYLVRCWAVNRNGVLSADYAELTFRTLSPRITVPTAPSDAAARSSAELEATIEWTDNSDNEQVFAVSRKETDPVPGAYAEIGTVAAGVTEYVDEGLTAGTTYQWRVLARNAAGDSATSETDELTVPAPLEEDSAPTDLVVQQMTDVDVMLSWTDNSSAELRFDIYSATSEGGVYSKIAEVGPNITTFVVTGLAAGEHWFRIDGINGTGTFGSTAVAGITLTGDTPNTPEPPTLAVSTVGVRTIRADVTVTDVATTNVLVRYRTTVGPGSWSSAYDDPPPVSRVMIGGLSPNTSYDVQAIASNVSGQGASSILAITTPRETGGIGLLPWRGKRTGWDFDFDKDDADRTVLTATTTTIVESFLCNPDDATNGPFAELFVDGVCVARANPVSGVARLRGWKVEAGSVIEVRIRGTGTGIGTCSGSLLGL